jgi:uncharacterized protein
MTSALAVVREFVAYLSEGDELAARELLSDDITVHEPESLPYGGDHTGKDAFFKLREAVGEVWEKCGEIERRELDCGAEHAVVIVRFPVKVRASNTEFELRISEAYTVRGGRITEMELYYFDTKQIWDVTRAAPSNPPGGGC